MYNTTASINLPIKDGADTDSKWKSLVKSAIVSMVGGAQFKDLSDMEREALSWIYTSED